MDYVIFNHLVRNSTSAMTFEADIVSSLSASAKTAVVEYVSANRSSLKVLQIILMSLFWWHSQNFCLMKFAIHYRLKSFWSQYLRKKWVGATHLMHRLRMNHFLPHSFSQYFLPLCENKSNCHYTFQCIAMLLCLNTLSGRKLLVWRHQAVFHVWIRPPLAPPTTHHTTRK